MPLSKKVKSNRRNSRKSTGPTTDQGKAIVAQNAVTHGMHATRVVIDSPHYTEDPKEYRLLLASLIWELEPDGVLQHHLVHKIANCLWRYKRIIRAETGALESNLERLVGRTFDRFSDRPDLETPEGREAYEAVLDGRRESFVNRCLLPDDDDSVKLLRYELRLDRQLTRAYRLLRRLQALRHRDRALEQKTTDQQRREQDRPETMRWSEHDDEQLQRGSINHDT